MRRLLYVPIVHDEADIGSAGAALALRSARLAGRRRWARHQQVLDRFWQQVGAFLDRFEANGLRVYQDGLPAGGEVGQRIVQEAAARGSRNHRLVLHLLERGAQLCQTEDPALLWRERQRLLEPSGQGGEERSEGNGLLAERDRFIAGAINATLREGEAGILFIGAYHDVTPYLAEDIAIEAVKEPEKVRAYFEALFVGRDAGRLAQLAEYLASPVGAA